MAQQVCSTSSEALLRVDQGSAWRPPFGVERIGSPLVVHVTLTGAQVPIQQYYVAAYRDEQELERHHLQWSQNPLNYSIARGMQPQPSPFFSHVQLASIPSEIALYVLCDGRTNELARQRVIWAKLEADASARPNHPINPIDLGTVLVPNDRLLLAGGQEAIITVAALSHERDVPNAKLRARFTGGMPVETEFPLTRNQRLKKELTVPSSVKGDRTILHISVTDGVRELWRKDIHTMITRHPPNWPTFGAVETKLRYDAPILVTDSETGATKSPVDYSTGWDEKLKDVVVFLPNGSRFVFWRGSSYIPFWAGKRNTGVSYQWTETSVPLADQDESAQDVLLEPLFDKELHSGRVRIMESSNSRVHVRWTYELPDYRQKVWGDQAAEDYYFYPDGFGTRVLTAPSTLGTFQQVSEFIILTPQAAYPLDVLPVHLIDVLSLNGGKGSVRFPVEKPIQPSDGQTLPRMGWGAEMRRAEPTLYRIFPHKDDPVSAIYFHPRDVSPLALFPPLYAEGQVVTPVYWGNHWPLSRGGWTTFAINDRITTTPAHNSIGGPLDGALSGYEPRPEVFESVGKSRMLDALGRPRDMTIRRWAWMIGMTDLSDAALIDAARSFASPPALNVRGARLDLPSYSMERRALRLVAEQRELEIMIKPELKTVNPVFEIDQVFTRLVHIKLNDEPLPPDSYAWDGLVLWVRASIEKEGAAIHLQFR